MASIFSRSQDTQDDGDEDWWYSQGAMAARWGIALVLVFMLMFWILAFYFHAQWRMRNGYPPLPYHRWLVPRAQLYRFESHHQQSQDQFSFYRAQGNEQGDGYDMQSRMTAPPPYNPNLAPPPTYQPPVGASKINPVQATYTPFQPSAGPSYDDRQHGVTSDLSLPPHAH